MSFKTRVVRGVAGGAVVLLGYEAVPQYLEPSECRSVGVTACPAENEYFEQRNEHLPHSEHDPMMPGGYRWIASGQVNSTSTGPSHFVPAGELLFRW